MIIQLHLTETEQDAGNTVIFEMSMTRFQELNPWMSQRMVDDILNKLLLTSRYSFAPHIEMVLPHYIEH